MIHIQWQPGNRLKVVVGGELGGGTAGQASQKNCICKQVLLIEFFFFLKKNEYETKRGRKGWRNKRDAGDEGRSGFFFFREQKRAKVKGGRKLVRGRGGNLGTGNRNKRGWVGFLYTMRWRKSEPMWGGLWRKEDRRKERKEKELKKEEKLAGSVASGKCEIA